MKKVVFAWVTVGYLFDSKEELDQYRIKNRSKYWNWGEPSEESDGKWYIEINRPYKSRYNCGW